MYVSGGRETRSREEVTPNKICNETPLLKSSSTQKVRHLRNLV